MIYDELMWQMRHAMPFEPTAGQAAAMDVFARFYASGGDRAVMILRGAAGTGKTSVAGAAVRALRALRQKMVLMAPTGRAAKVFALNAGCPAFTIHRRIYRQKTFTGRLGGFQLNVNMQRDTLFIVDEASMIANTTLPDAPFGSGCLLDDLVEYVYSAEGCRLMLIGDMAQLPPVGEDVSPALSSSHIRGYGLQVHECGIDEVLRQAYGSGILSNATTIRQLIAADGRVQLPQVVFRGFADIQVVMGNDLARQLADSYSHVGMDETIVITRSNKRAGIYNAGIRQMILDREETLSRGDMLMVVKNNYYWKPPRLQAPDDDDAMDGGANRRNGDGKNGAMADVNSKDGRMDDGDDGRQAAAQQELPSPAFIANGDRASVVRVRHEREFYGLHFADVTLSFPDYNDMEMTVTAILDALSTETPALTRDQQEALFEGVLADHGDLTRKGERMRAVKEDPLFNALQVKYAYAVTCHKAQGGQWSHVYVDQGFMTDDMLTPSYIHWLYTAFTRATTKLFLVNWPKTQTKQ